jgi:hypothetical protein
MDRDERLKENEETFKVANERLESVVAERLSPADKVPFLCECADSACMGRIELTLGDYDAIRAHERHFLMLPEHPRTAGEEVLERRDGYEITEKPE